MPRSAPHQQRDLFLRTCGHSPARMQLTTRNLARLRELYKNLAISQRELGKSYRGHGLMESGIERAIAAKASAIGPSRRFQRLTILVAIGEQRARRAKIPRCTIGSLPKCRTKYALCQKKSDDENCL
jgi:hypothetical protein